MSQLINDIELIFPFLHKPSNVSSEFFHTLIALYFGNPIKALNYFIDPEDELISDVLVRMEILPSKSEYYRAVKAQSLKFNNLPLKRESVVSDFTFLEIEGLDIKFGVLKTGKISHSLLLI